MSRGSFREKVLRVREDAIVTSVNRLLAQKGFDLMTVDEVAADVGLAKTSLYKHFASKEALAGAAMLRALDRALAEVARLEPGATPPIDRLGALVRWAVQTQLAGEMPTLPSQNSTLRAALLADQTFIARVMQLSDALRVWIVAAQASGDIEPTLPAEVVLYALYARACDPMIQFLAGSGNYTDAQIVELVLATCFKGLAARAACPEAA